MFVMKVFENKETTDVVDELVLDHRVIVDSVLVLAVVTDGVLQLQYFC